MSNTVPPWLSLDHPALVRYAVELPGCLLLIDPQEENAPFLATELAAAALCTGTAADSPPQACGQCQACRLRRAATHPDLILHCDILPIDDIRRLIERLSQTPSIADKRVIFLKNIDRYNENALNALLKTLEEPGRYNRFILSAANRRAVKPTILSRAQTHNVAQPDPTQAVAWLVNQGWEEKQAAILLPLYRHNPYYTANLTPENNPLELFADFIAYCAAPDKQRAFLRRLDDYPAERLTDILAVNCTHLIRARQLDSWPQNWQNPESYRTLLNKVDIQRLHHFYAALSALRRSQRQQINLGLNLKSLLLHHMETRNPTL